MNRRTLALAAAASAATCVVASSAAAQCDAFTFRPHVHASGSDPGSVAFGRLDGDALYDMAVTDGASASVKVLIGTSGSFATPTSWPAGWAPRAVDVGDLDGDGDFDLAVCDQGYSDATGWHDVGLRVLWNDGAGGFASSSLMPLAAGAILPSDVALGDLDNDGDLDAVMTLRGTSPFGKVAPLLNDGLGHLTAAATSSCGYDPVRLVLGELNGDGVLDVVTANYLGNSFSRAFGTGAGTFGVGFSQSTTYVQDVALGDFDLDGRLDLAVAYRYGVILARNVSGNFQYVSTLSSGLLPAAVVFADLDGDGDADLVSADKTFGSLYVWLNGAGTLTLREQVPVRSVPWEIAARDVDLDGDVDLGVVVLGSDGVAVVRNECPLSTYCVAKQNSAGCWPSIGWSGTPSLSGADDFHVTATQELNQHLGLAFFGLAAANVPFGGGIRCVQSPLLRTPSQNSGGNVGPPDCSGAYDFHVSYAWLAQRGWGAGTELFGQYWSRDPMSADGTNVALSNAMRFVIQP
jgi:hypothetical protein